MTAPTVQQPTGAAATTAEGTSSSAPPLPDDSIFVPIDLEASLGRIEDHKQQTQQQQQQQTQKQQQQQQQQTDQQQQQYQSSSGYGPVPTTPGGRTKPTRTLSKAPQQAQHIIAPFPVVETPDELYERQKLTSTIMMGLSSSAVLSNNSNTFTSPIQPPPLFDCGAGEIDLRLPISAGPDDHDDDDCDQRDGVMDDEDMVVSRNDLDLVPNDDNTNSNNGDFETDMASVDEDGGGCDNDDFSLSAEEANSLQDEDLHLETIQHDPVGFWETPATTTTTTEAAPQQQQFIPGSVSFSSSSPLAAAGGQQQESSGMDWQ
mmetsp:Transcript_50132/g.121471  ORF Transcript_50132/g.121471 Transcript_50132/m.121471 type:complete len:317 (-) Transcript_50132:106-1056(-)